MKKEKVLSTLFWLVMVLKIGIFGGLSYIEKLSYQKAGVNHHLRFRKTQLVRQHFTEMNTMILLIIGAVFIIGALYLYFKYGKKHTLSLIHISEPTRREWLSRMPSSA